ncbi:Ger(x)C family spore germination protein [Chengkuizengella axinellae]|uniref:Ger(X)C family spore germination protein n=1 Tax=Chengkuizengella axinellae TaxID=3064388 RepID=A0ABT9J503_9BACL|nr:Ger(x)C family spore germination protein [Chengkuizengella sp. 2205SS18-9]MDP5276682.1 Ger(x)C family spore germination protein [Chengkuizengella sp. 2205SS18-9]
MLKKLLLILSIFILLTGCWNSDEVDRMLYAHALGVDFKDNLFEIHVQFVIFGGRGGQGREAGGSLTPTVEKGTGKTIEEALFDLYKAVPEKVFWGHLSAIVFSDNMMKERGKLNDVIEKFIRFPETRYTIWMYSSSTEALDEILKVGSFKDMNLSPIFGRLGDPKNNYEQSSLIKPVNFNDLLIELDEPSYTSIIPYIQLKSEGKEEHIRFNSVSVLYTRNEFKGILKETEIDGFRWMHSDIINNNLLVEDQNNNLLASIIIDKLKVKIIPEINHGVVTYQIKLKAKAYVSELFADVTQEKLTQLAKKKIKAQILTTYKLGLDLNADVYRLTETLYRKDPKKWKELTSNNKLPLTESSVETEINLLIKSSSNLELTP